MDVRTAVPPAPDVVESPRPRSRLARAGHALADWARGSSGRLVLPAVLVSATLVLSGAILLPYLEPVFGKIQQDFEPRNILPARLFHCTP